MMSNASKGDINKLNFNAPLEIVANQYDIVQQWYRVIIWCHP